MKLDSKRTVELIGIVALVASLLFVGLQLQQSQAITRFEGITDGATRNIAYRTLIADNADVWSRGCLAEDLTLEDQVIFAKLHSSYIDNAYAQWNRLRQADFAFENSDASSRRFAANPLPGPKGPPPIARERIDRMACRC